MPGRVAHIAINADDDGGVTQAFYEGVFDWRFEPYYPGFVRTPIPLAREMVAAIQTRRDLVPGQRTTGPEVTIEVDDIAAALGQVVKLGGRVVMQRSTIPTVGDLAFVADPSNNLIGIIEYLRS